MNSPVYQSQFSAVMHSILAQDKCDAKAGPECVSCQSPAGAKGSAMIHPASYLHKADEAFIMVMVQPTCGSKKCRRYAQDMIHNSMNYASDYVNPEGECAVCGMRGKHQRCAACQVVTYCSRECQRARWKEHKSACKVLKDDRKAMESG